MKKLRLAIALLLTIALTFALAACGDTGSNGSNTDSGVADSGNTDTGSNDTGSSDTGSSAELRIVIVTSGSSVDDGSFNQDNYEGINDFIAANPLSTVTAITSEEIANSISDVEAVVADYDVIVTPGFQFAAISEIAAENPDKYFILVDEHPTPVDGQDSLPNVYAMKFKEQESGFFAGIAAALETQTGKVAFIGGMAFPPVVNYQFGFEAGVLYANTNLGANAEIVNLPLYAGVDVLGNDVGGNYVNDFGDPATGKIIGEALINEGVDILFIAAGGSGMGGFTAAKESTGIRVIGCDVDQFDDGVYPDGNIVLTSGLKNMRVNVTRQLNAIKDGTFTGGNYVLGADTDSTGFVSADGRHQLSGDTLTAVQEAYNLVKSGDLVPPDNFSEGNLPR